MPTTIDLRCECLGVPETGATRLLWVALAAKEIPRKTERAQISLAVVLDRSGSMRGAKLDYAKQAAVATIRALDGRDRFCLVAYDNEVDVVFPSQPATPPNRQRVEQAIAQITTGGMTALHAGWKRGCGEVETTLGPDQLGRCLLLTDGLANEGVTDRHTIVNDVARQRGRKVATSTFGVGADFDEAMLQGMAEAGAGNFYFIDQPAQIVEFIASEVGEVLEIAVPDASLFVTVSGPGYADVELRSLNDYPVTTVGPELEALGPDTRAWSVELGSLISGQLLDPLLGLELPAAAVGTELRLTVALRSGGQPMKSPTREAVFTTLDVARLAAAPVDLETLRRGAALDASRVSQQGLELNRDGQLDAAKKLLTEASTALRERAKNDPELLALAAELAEKGERYGTRLDAVSRKMQYFEDYMRLKGKGAGGRSRRVGQPEPSHSAPAIQIDTGPNINQGPNVAVGPNINQGPNIVQGANINPSPNVIRQTAEGPIPATGVVVLPTTPALIEQANRAVFVLASAASELLPRLRAYPVLLPGPIASELEGRPLEQGEEISLVERAAQLSPNASARLIITGRPLPDQWFSHVHPHHRTAVASLHGWTTLSALPTEAFLAYQMLIHGLVATSPRYRHRDLLHQDTRGCLYDLCQDKALINIKLRHGDLCPECERALTGLGIPVDQVRLAAAAIHALSKA